MGIYKIRIIDTCRRCASKSEITQS